MMQDFWDNEFTKIGLYQCKIGHFYILFYIHDPAIFFELRKYHKITQIQNGH